MIDFFLVTFAVIGIIFTVVMIVGFISGFVSALRQRKQPLDVFQPTLIQGDDGKWDVYPLDTRTQEVHDTWAGYYLLTNEDVDVSFLLATPETADDVVTKFHKVQEYCNTMNARTNQ